MNPIFRRLLTALSALMLFLPEAARSQAPEVPPLEPLRAPTDAAWTIDIKYLATPEKDSPGPRPVRAKSVSVQKQRDVFHETVAFDDGKMRERWVLKGIQFETSDGGSQVTRLLPSDSSASDYSETDFPDLAWVSGLKPRLIEENRNQLLLVEVAAADRPMTSKQKRERSEMEQLAGMYDKLSRKNEGTAAGKDNPVQPSEPKPVGTLRLFLDAKTKLPVRFESPTEIRTYSYSSELLPLRPPEHFKGAYESWRKEFLAASRPSSRP
ncbi:MAG: hypothetical protein NTV93_17095 [Verrucomicrobia bacterium]|nr:hypothetical protein [Verrucomicrobiota bacterium]